MSGPRLGDLIRVPPVRTVVQLGDLADASLAQHLREDFVCTAEAGHALQTILGAVGTGRGQGFFVQGSYGSGKSHLLAVLALAARGAGLPPGAQLPELDAAHRPVPVTVSLVEHSGREALEDVVLAGLAATSALKGIALTAQEASLEQAHRFLEANHPEQLAAFKQREGIADAAELFRPGMLPQLEAFLAEHQVPLKLRADRRAAFDAVWSAVGTAGALLLMDELSEFLRSKPTAAAFHEDVRFLQFLGEEGLRHPLWVVATLQEAIETAGEIPPETFRKIKDRYPVRLSLTGRHLAELVERRLVVRTPEAAAAADDLHRRLTAAFGELPFPRHELRRLYPVHPATVEFLEQLRHLFSQHRGAVDFIHSRLAGDPARKIPGVLDQPPTHLLGPEELFDHFRDRIRETPETTILSEQVFAFFEQQLPRLVPEAEDRPAALALVKLLLLGALLPYPRDFSPPELAVLLLRPVVGADPAVNLEYVAGLLELLFKGGAYLTRTESADPLQRRYRLDARSDTAAVVERRLAHLRREIAPDDRRAFTLFLPWLEDRFLPLAQLDGPASSQTVLWQQTLRRVMVFLAPLEELAEQLEPLRQAVAQGQADAVLCIGHALREENTELALFQRVLPALPRELAPAIRFWLPGKVADPQALREALAFELLREQAGEEEPTAARSLREYLDAHLPEQRRRVQELYRDAYFSGRLLDASGEVTPPGPPTVFSDLLTRIAAQVLQERFPRHQEIAPKSADALTARTVEQLVAAFLVPGALGSETPNPFLQQVVGNFLEPMHLARRSGRSFHLSVDSRANPLVAESLGFLERERRSPEELFRHLSQSKWGLTREPFRLLLLALIHSGNAAAYVGGRRRDPAQINGLDDLARVEELGPGDVLDPAQARALTALSFLPPRLQHFPLSYAQQRDTWDFLRQFKEEALARAEAVRTGLAALEGVPAFAAWDTASLQADLVEVRRVLDAIRVSYHPREGLEHFLAAYGAAPRFEQQLDRLEQLDRFLRERREKLLFMHGYLTAAAGIVPEAAGDERRRLAERCTEVATALDPSAFAALEADFAAFRERHAAWYLAEHQRLAGPERLRPYAAVRSGEAYRALELLSTLEAVPEPETLRRARSLLEQVRAAECRQLAPADLLLSPLCRCGLRPGQPAPLPGVSQIQAALQAALADYAATLAAEPFRSQILGYIGGLVDVGERHAAEPVRRLLEGTDPDRLARGVTRSVVETLRRALAGRHPLAVRRLQDLAGLLAGRVFPPGKIRELVDGWLRGEEGLAEDSFVRVEGIGGTDTAPSRLAEVVAADFPELAQPTASLSPTLLALEALTARWRELHSLAAPPPPPALAAWSASLADLGRRIAAEPALAGVLAAARRQAAAADQEAELWELLARRAGGASPALARDLAGEELFPGVARRVGIALLETLAREEDLAVLAQVEAALEHAPAGEGYPAAASRAARLAADLAAAGDPERLDTPRQWEAAQEGYLGRLEADLARLVRSLERLSTPPPDGGRPLTERSRRILEEHRRAFARFLRRGQTGRTLADVLRLPRERWFPAAPAGLFLVLLDGARYDTWPPLLEPCAGAFRVLRQGLAWAALPTVTATQLDRAGAALKVEVVPCEGCGADLAALDNRELAPGRAVLAKFDLVDRRLHDSRADYAAFLEELTLAARRDLVPFLDGLPPRAVVLLTADHGFRENPAFPGADPHATPRYLHGGDTPEEVLVPWQLWLKQG
ncbi:MAG: DUF6079 family protein [Thermaerobacter sp.]|nr:DUF6079 family protein [Thermaerobacter sp.]